MKILLLSILFLISEGFSGEEVRDSFQPIPMRTGFSHPVHLTFEEARAFFTRRITTRILPQIMPLLPENIVAMAPATLVNDLAIHDQTPSEVLGGYFARLGSALINEGSLDEDIRCSLAYSSFLRAGNYYLNSVRNLPPSVERIDRLVSAAQCYQWSMIRSPVPRSRALLFLICQLNLQNAQRQAERLTGEEDRSQWAQIIRGQSLSLREALLSLSRGSDPVA